MAGGLGPLAGVGNSCEAPTKVGRVRGVPLSAAAGFESPGSPQRFKCVPLSGIKITRIKGFPH